MEVRETRRLTAHRQSQETLRSEATLESAESQKTRKKPTRRKPAKKFLFRDHPLILGIVVIAWFIACLEVGGNILYHHYTYASYQPAQCLIQDKQVESSYSNSSTSHSRNYYYMPSFTYQIITSDGGKPNAYPGYAGPGYGSAQNSMSMSDKAQAVLDHYQIGQTYPCWYSSLGSQSKAVLVLQDYPWWELILTSLGTLFSGFTSACVVIYALYIRYRNWRLRKKGIATTGMVKKRHIEFEIYTDPIRKIRVKYNRSQLKQGSEVTVVYYDPRYPQSNYSIAALPKGNTFLVCCLTLFPVAITVLFMVLFWNG